MQPASPRVGSTSAESSPRRCSSLPGTALRWTFKTIFVALSFMVIPYLLNVDPAMRAGTREYGFHDLQLTQAVGELRVLNRCVAVGNGLIKTPQCLLERIVIAFTVATGQI